MADSGVPEVKFRLIPGAWGTQRLAHLLGKAIQNKWL
jgi:enoyl-CoA hydratase/carnithine racemase